MVDPLDPLFQTIGQAYVQQVANKMNSTRI